MDIELRYCGDGILEPENGEVCDPEDPSRTGHGNGGCNTNTCQPIEAPTCNALTVDVNSGEAPQNIVTSCEGFKVGTWEIDCGNGQTFSGNGNNGGTQTFNRTCKYTDAGTYTPTCTINGSITGNSCRKQVNITNPGANIVIDKRDGNVFDFDDNVGNDTQTVYSTEEAVFTIRVTNNGDDRLEDIRLTDGRAPACATPVGSFVNLAGSNFINRDGIRVAINYGGPGNHTNRTLEPGEYFEYTCSKANTQSNYTNTARVDAR